MRDSYTYNCVRQRLDCMIDHLHVLTNKNIEAILKTIAEVTLDY